MNPFALLMLGLALVLVNVQIAALGNYEVPPDVVGYAVAVFALNNLVARVSSGSARYPALQLARTVASLLLLFSLPDLVPPAARGAYERFIWLGNVGSAALFIAFSWYLLDGIRLWAREVGETNLALQAGRRRFIVAGLAAGILTLVLVRWYLPDGIIPPTYQAYERMLVIAPNLVQIVLAFFLLATLFRAAQNLTGGPPPSETPPPATTGV